MSRFFVTDPPVAIREFDETEVVSDKPPNVVWIKARMDVATRGKVSGELLKLGENGQGVEGHLGNNNLALLLHNIIRWEGPDFVDEMGRAIPCSPENIKKLDTNDPFIERILDEIGERNAKRASPKEGSATNSGSTNAGAVVSDGSPAPDGESQSLQLATGNWKSPLQSAMAGRRNKSDD
jgi:hypothetical protein